MNNTDTIISTRGTHTVSAGVHPDTGNLRISVYQPKGGWAYYFFRDRLEAVTWLEDALELIDPEGGSDA